MPRPNRGPRLEPNEGGIYEIRWTEAGRSKRVSTGAGDAAEAADAFRVWKQGVARESDAAGAGTVRGLLDSYFAEHVYRKVVGQGTAEICRKHLLAHFADMAPTDIQPSDVREYTKLRRKGAIGRVAGDSTVRRELGVLVAALGHAVAERRMKRADMPSVPLPEAGEPRDRWLTESEVGRLLATAEKPGYDQRLTRAGRFAFLAYYVAGRKTALTEMEWGQVDWDTNMLRLDKAGRRRTKKRRATVAMHPRLRAVLERAFVEREGPWVLDQKGDIRKAWATLVKAAGLPADVTPHVMRHTAATHMLRRKVPIAHVAAVLGDTVATVQRVYGHHMPEAMAEAVGALL